MGGVSTAGIFGIGAGVTGMGLSLYNAVKDSIDDDSSIAKNLALGPATYASGGGVAALMLAEKGNFQKALTTGIRGGGLALVLGGIAGAVIGTIPTFKNPHDERYRDNTLIQRGQKFEPRLPRSIAELEGVSVANGEAITVDGDVQRVPVYVDPTTAKELKTDDLAQAISQARAASQADVDDRSFAILQTADHDLWMARLSGGLDQVDGRNYTKDTKFDPRFQPKLVKSQPALLAVSGVESRWVFPEHLDPEEGAPQIDQAMATEPTLPKPTTTTPTTTTPTTTTPTTGTTAATAGGTG